MRDRLARGEESAKGYMNSRCWEQPSLMGLRQSPKEGGLIGVDIQTLWEITWPYHWITKFAKVPHW